MTLEAYLAETQMNMSEFARRVGVKPQTIQRYVKQGRAPEWAVMERIVLATAGKVTANDFLGVAA